MGFNNTVTVVGNVTRDPELRFTPSGAAVTSFGLAWNRKGQNDEEVVSFFDVTCWSGLAENVAESITKGSRVVVYGRLDQRSWENQDGERRSKVEIVADTAGHQRAVGLHRAVAGEVGEAAGDDNRLVHAHRRRGGREFDAEFLDFSVCAHVDL